jgi:putative endonuclease
MFYFYILYSASRDIYYKGVTEDVNQRLAQHNKGETQSTKSGCPWEIVFVQSFTEKRGVLKRELQVKKWNRDTDTIINLIGSPIIKEKI